MGGDAGGYFGLAHDGNYTLRLTADFGGRTTSPTRSPAGAAVDNLALAEWGLGGLDRSSGTDGRLVVHLGGRDDAAYGVVVQGDG